MQTSKAVWRWLGLEDFRNHLCTLPDAKLMVKKILEFSSKNHFEYKEDPFAPKLSWRSVTSS